MQFRRAETLEEALSVLSELGADARILAGGTDLIIQYLAGEIAPKALVHIESIQDLATISFNQRTTLGSLVTHRVVARDEMVGVAHPALAASARTVGGWQTQSVGTIGGNICNASPAADTAPPLLVADAYVTLISSSRTRRIAVADFLIDRRQTAMGPEEMLKAIDLEPLPEGSGEVYLKLGRRGGMEVAVVGLAVRLGFSSDGAVNTARIAFCSVGPIPRRVPEAEEALIGSHLEASAIDTAGEALRAAASPIDDSRASASYRRRTLRGLLGRAAIRCRESVAL